MNPQHDLDNIYTYHEPTGPEQLDRYVRIRKTAKEMAKLILAECPSSREQSLAITKLEEAVMWANAAIARNG